MSAPTLSDMEFERYLDQYIRYVKHNGGMPNTTGKYEEILRRLDRNLPAGLLRACTEELEDWIWKDDRAPKTLAAYRSIVAGFFLFATDEVQLGEHRLDFNPARYLPKVKIPRRGARPAQMEQLRDILARAPEPVRTWFLIAAGQGLRNVDLSGLDREDCTPESMYLTGKGGVQREIMMHPEVWKVIEPMPSGPVARARSGERATPKKIMELGNYRLRKLGYPKLTMHKLRVFFVTELHEAAGGDILVAQNQAGHADPATTLIYVAVNRPKSAAAVAAIPLPV